MDKIKQYDVGKEMIFPILKNDGFTKKSLKDVKEVILRFKIEDNPVQERPVTIILNEDPDPDYIKYVWKKGDLDDSGILQFEVRVKYITDDQFTTVGYKKIMVEGIIN